MSYPQHALEASSTASLLRPSESNLVRIVIYYSGLGLWF